MRRAGAALLCAGLALSGSAATGAPSAINKSDNVRHVAHFPYVGGTDLDFSGRFVYAGRLGDQGGVGIYDVSGRKPKKAAFIACPGSQNDVAIVRPGLLALAYHSGLCGAEPGAGVRLIDVSDPKRPRFLGKVELPGGTHTLTVYPGEPIIYASPGGLANGGGAEQILDVSDPTDIEIAATYNPNRIGCHDVTFKEIGERMLAFCPGLGETQIWDVTDPVAPRTIGHALSPSFFPHHAVATPDGSHLILTDEAFAVHDCAGGPTGSVWVFDITIPEAPVLAGHWGPQRGAGIASVNGWCTAHNLNFIEDTDMAVISWYTGGTSVLDVSDPLFPVEVAYFQPDNANTWSSYYYGGRIYANDGNRGLDVIEVKGVFER